MQSHRKSASEVEARAAIALLENAKDFLNAGLNLLFAEKLDRQSVKLAVISLQTAVELLVKYRLLQESGLAAIMENLNPGVDIESIRTITFSASIKAVESLESFVEWEYNAILKMAALRNKLIHFSTEVEPEVLKGNCLSLICSALAMFAKGQSRDYGEMVDYSTFLSAGNLLVLTSNESYRSEALDAAYDNIDSKAVKYCYKCKCESLSLRTSDVYFCHCCGFTIDKEVVSFATCAICSAHSMVFYDALNITGVSHYGKCMACERFQWVQACRDCDRITVTLKPLSKSACACLQFDQSNHL
ncbi:hypothetical protein [Pseudomonas sp.]|uniref:hypothetical protein n=1 Tax=Pseudomonas sp. TaxID=306 RepID=UPI003BB5ABE9